MERISTQIFSYLVKSFPKGPQPPLYSRASGSIKWLISWEMVDGLCFCCDNSSHTYIYQNQGFWCVSCVLTGHTFVPHPLRFPGSWRPERWWEPTHRGLVRTSGKEEALWGKGGRARETWQNLVSPGPLLHWNLPWCSHPNCRVFQCSNFNLRVPVRLGIQLALYFSQLQNLRIAGI